LFSKAIKKQIKQDSQPMKLPGILGQLADLAEKGSVAKGYFVSFIS